MRAAIKAGDPTFHHPRFGELVLLPSDAAARPPPAAPLLATATEIMARRRRGLGLGREPPPLRLRRLRAAMAANPRLLGALGADPLALGHFEALFEGGVLRRRRLQRLAAEAGVELEVWRLRHPPPAATAAEARALAAFAPHRATFPRRLLELRAAGGGDAEMMLRACAASDARAEPRLGPHMGPLMQILANLGPTGGRELLEVYDGATT